MPIPALPLFKHRETVVTPADQNQFVTQFENTMDTLSNGVIPAINLAITDINAKTITATTARDEAVSAKNIAVAAKDEALTAVATLQEGAIDDTTIAPNKAFSNQYTNDNFVKLTGNQTIAGAKTFSSNIIGNITGNATNATNVSGGYGTFGGIITTKVNNTNFAQASDAALSVRGDGTYPASMSFHRAGAFAVNFGLDTDNKLKVGGWSMGSVYEIYHQGNPQPSTTYASAFTTVVGSAPSYACRAWVNFNGTGAVAIRASGNVSSITDNGAGDYTVNFTTAMPDINYSGSCSASGFNKSGGSYGTGSGVLAANLDMFTTTSTSLKVNGTNGGGNNTAFYLADSTNILISIFR